MPPAIPRKKTVMGGPFFVDGEELHAKALDYLQWCEDNPHVTEKQAVHEGKVVRYDVSKSRVPSQSGFCQYIGCSVHSFQTWLRGTRNPDLQEAAQQAADMFRNAQVELGAAGIISAPIAIRMAGLVERQELQQQIEQVQASAVDPDDVPNLVHPDAPIEDQLSDNPLLFSKRQLDSGVPYPTKVIEHKDAAE